MFPSRAKDNSFRTLLCSATIVDDVTSKLIYVIRSEVFARSHNCDLIWLTRCCFVCDVPTELESRRGGRGDNFLYTTKKMDVPAKWPPFSALPGIWLAPPFQQNVYDWIFLIGIWKAPIFWHPVICTHFSLRDFTRLHVSLGIQWFDCDICLITSNKWVQKSKGSIWMGQHFRRSNW